MTFFGRRYLNARPNVDGSISELAFMGRVIQTLQLYGWTTYHTHDSRGSEAGFPDVAAGRMEPYPRLLFIETKSRKGRVRPEQKVWIDILTAVQRATSWANTSWNPALDRPPTVEVMVLRPQDDWDAFIEKIKHPLPVWERTIKGDGQ